MKVGCSLIGTPAGFEELPARINEGLELAHILDFPNRELTIFPRSEIFKFSRLEIGDVIYNVFSYYRFAIEANNIRPGSYYGSSVTLKNSEADGGNIVKALRDMADLVRVECIDDSNRFIKRLTEIQGVNIPPSLEALEKTCVEIKRPKNYLKVKGSNRLFCRYPNNNGNLSELVEWCHNIYLYNDIDTVFLSNSEEVEKSALAKGVLGVVVPEKLKEVITENKKEHQKLLNPPKSKDKKRRQQNTNNSNVYTEQEENSGTETTFNSSYGYSSESIGSGFELERKRRDVLTFLLTEGRAKAIAIIFFLLGLSVGLFTGYLLFSGEDRYAHVVDGSGGNDDNGKQHRQISNPVTTDDNTGQDAGNDSETAIVSNPAVANSKCDWAGKTNRWTYTGENLRTVKELTSTIVNHCGKHECPEWENKIDSILKVFNANDIDKTTGNITKHGSIVFRIPEAAVINLNGFEK